ncbi:STY4526/YPO1902 family pathogenicity island replication protein [Vibrio parahaemolyticus]|uniref:STY4526/YPO1902 family pathogenicity island replication protein n=1 Tax=Vibrio parahaemolyticus TaxID=670 RepID=UPI0011ECC39B|nr:STY4526/YPO1902 family pathogenicity island replication protein [Vibrio parahaemolyticus]KAB5597896.1 DUF2857 family protein [Vibrio parahaemolyticus]
MQEIETLLTSEISHAIISKLVSLAHSGQKPMLKAVGMDDGLINKFEKMSFMDVRQFVENKCCSEDVQSFQSWLQALLKNLQDEVPEPCREFLLHGASNELMFHCFRAGPAQCSQWRARLTIKRLFRARTISDKKHGEVCKSLAKALEGKSIGEFRQLSPDVLLAVAKEHQVSLGALWHELEVWESLYEQEKNPA